MTGAAIRVVIVAPEGVTGSLRVLIERLVGLGIDVATVDDVSTAADHVAREPSNPPCVMLDLRELTSADADEQRLAIDAIKRAAFVIPQCTPVVVTGEAPTGLLLACLRAGAADLLDLGVEGTATVRQVVTRVWQRQRELLAELAERAKLRGMVEDLLKDLIKTERRSLALEDQVTAYREKTKELEPLGDSRPPAIVIVEPDRVLAGDLATRLGAAGLVTYVFARGEDAVKRAGARNPGESYDLAVVSAELAGLDGLATIQRLREQFADLPAFVMTSGQDGELAARAADLGVVGFVRKPVVGLDEIVTRLADLAKDALARAREHSYLERIKTRHEHVLARYRALPRNA